MITSLSWLKNHLSTKANLNQVAERLTEIGLEVENIKSSNINLDNFKDRKVIGITAGASAPEILINEVTEFLVSKGAELGNYNQSETKEDIIFTIPKELR